MTLRNRGTPTGFSAWVAPFRAYDIRRANRQDLALENARREWLSVGRSVGIEQQHRVFVPLLERQQTP